MSAKDLLHISRLDEPTARLALALMHRLEAAWANHPASQEFSLANLIAEWLDMIVVARMSPSIVGQSDKTQQNVVPLPPATPEAPPTSVASRETVKNQRPVLDPLPGITGPAHADLRLAGLALALDLIELRALYPDEPADWVGHLALDRRTRITFIKE
jgi:hypothetical protein